MLDGAVLTVEPTSEEDGSWIWSLLPWLIFFGIYFWFWNRMQSNIAGRFGGRVRRHARPTAFRSC